MKKYIRYLSENTSDGVLVVFIVVVAFVVLSLIAEFFSLFYIGESILEITGWIFGFVILMFALFMLCKAIYVFVKLIINYLKKGDSS